jgi:hypothetical protein
LILSSNSLLDPHLSKLNNELEDKIKNEYCENVNPANSAAIKCLEENYLKEKGSKLIRTEISKYIWNDVLCGGENVTVTFSK